MTAYWVGVASKDHVLAGMRGGFAQLGHGKRSALDKVRPGDRLVYYSPREQMGAGRRVQAFTAVCEILDVPVRRARADAKFHPFRRDARFLAAKEAPISPMLQQLSFTKGHSHWGLPFRRGAFRITEDDYLTISRAMQILACDGTLE